MKDDHMNEAAAQRFARYREIVLEIISRNLPHCKVYLFGSRARGTNQPGADIDLALDCGSPIDFHIILKLHDEIEETTMPLTVDLVDLYSASDTLKNEVKKEGILWES
ncbi:MAG: nucleotidyltransferase domain-containing protein [Candidatus Babeliales bacterium]|jgi:predicted nucleotidyltransferase